MAFVSFYLPELLTAFEENMEEKIIWLISVVYNKCFICLHFFTISGDFSFQTVSFNTAGLGINCLCYKIMSFQ
jgi:hypothetical protein